MKPSIHTLNIDLGRKDGSVLPPLVLWILGVPGFVALLLWLFVFRG
ncbi:MAG TPA: hypothetical protein VM901_07410 [Bdellovibrionota bacterium]|nr:hypothetical protein [Bdellovibrionota bacterium]